MNTRTSMTGQQIAQLVCSPETQAALSLYRLNQRADGLKDTDLDALHAELVAHIEKVNRGDLRGAEARLAAQATVLDNLFYSLMRLGLGRTDANLGQLESIVRLALKAQTQCRVTLESLVAIRTPLPAAVQQTNIAHGPQQVNNGVT